MNVVTAIISLIAGLGAFLIGFKILSESTEKLANTGLRRLFEKTSNKALIGVGIGAATTVVVQSSSVTTVMVVGFVNSGLMSLYQATALIMGANIGTTVTAQIVALQTIDIAQYATLLTCIGVFINMFAKVDKAKTIGLALAGVGLVFVSLELMSGSMDGFRESDSIVNALANINNPILLLLLGALITGIVQSSAAVTTIIISMVGAGIMIGSGGNSVLYVILGTNIGTCVTALLSSIGAGTNAKRASLIHLMFNVFGSIIFLVVLLLWGGFSDNVLARLFEHPETQIAMFHTLFNVTCTLAFLPFIKVFVRIAQAMIKDKTAVEEKRVQFIDDRLLITPSVAIAQVQREVVRMSEMCMASLIKAINAFYEHDVSSKSSVDSLNADIYTIDKQIVDYLVKLSANDLSLADEKLLSSLHHVLADILRISEVADNITKYTATVVDMQLTFSDSVMADIRAMVDNIKELHTLSVSAFQNGNEKLLPQVDAVEDKIDKARATLIEAHIKRLNDGACKAQNSGIFINLVSNLERVGDHLTFFAHSIE